MRRLSIAVAVLLVLSPFQARAQDPATVAAGAKQLYDLFQQQKKEDSYKEIESRLKAIEGQLQAIRDTVERIAATLSRLEVAINEQPDTESRTRAFSQINLVADNIGRWSRDRGKKETREEVRSQLHELEREANNLMQRRSWPNYQAVAMCMLVERDLRIYLEEEAIDRSKRFERYRQYFHDAQSANTAGSIAQRHDAFAKLATDIRTLLAQQPAHPTCFVGKAWLTKESNSRYICKYHIHQFVVGNVRDGYCYVNRTERRNEHACYSDPSERNDHHGRDHVDLGAGGEFLLARMSIEPPQPISGCVPRMTPSEQNPLSPAIGTDPNSWCADALNAKRNEYISHTTNADTLQAALDAAAMFEQQANRLKALAK